MEVEYLTSDFVFFIHAVAIDKEFCVYGEQVKYSNELRGIKDTNLYNSALYEPKQSFDGQDLYPDVITKASCYLRSFAMDHPFHDGNKRTAVLATIVFLEMNGYKTTCTNQELYQLVKNIVENKSEVKEIAEQLKRYVRVSKMSKFKEIFRWGNRLFSKNN